MLMSEVLTTTGNSYQIEQLLIRANDHVYIVAPYLQLSKILVERMLETSNRNVPITIVYGKSKLKPIEREKLESIRTASVYHCENLHAKCYANETNAIVSSMNLYEFSERNNRELGVLLNVETDNASYLDVIREIKSILSISKCEKTEENEKTIADEGEDDGSLFSPFLYLNRDTILHSFSGIKEENVEVKTSFVEISNYLGANLGVRISHKIQIFSDKVKDFETFRNIMMEHHIIEDNARLFWKSSKVYIYPPKSLGMGETESIAEFKVNNWLMNCLGGIHSTLIQYMPVKLPQSISE